MIPEQREKVERTSLDGGVYNVEQKLQSYLRDKFSIDALSSASAKECAKKLLAQVAQDYCLSHNDERQQDEYYNLASDAIDTYITNWTDKKQGEDNRGHVFGKIRK